MLTDLTQFLAQPFSADMSATKWFLFVGLMLVLLWGWHKIFRELSSVEGAIA